MTVDTETYRSFTHSGLISLPHGKISVPEHLIRGLEKESPRQSFVFKPYHTRLAFGSGGRERQVAMSGATSVIEGIHARESEDDTEIP